MQFNLQCTDDDNRSYRNVYVCIVFIGRDFHYNLLISFEII